MSTKNKKPQVVVITGATAGVGRATVRAFAREGAFIGLLARNLQRLKDTKNEVETLGGKALIFSVDVANAEQVENATKEIITQFGPIDIWVNNAMVSVFSPAKETSAEEYKRVTEVTYLGFVYGTLSALKWMLPNNHGIIVQVGSALAYRGIPFQSAYCGAKHAIQGFTESLRCELMHEKSNVRISMVQLPAMNTPHFSWVKNRLPGKPKPVSPIFQPEVAAHAIVWATKHYRREWYVAFPTILAIFADKIAAGFCDWYLGKTGYKKQQCNEPSSRNQLDNLFQTLPSNFEAHGSFDHESKTISINLWLNQRRHFIFFGCLFIAILIVFLLS